MYLNQDNQDDYPNFVRYHPNPNFLQDDRQDEQKKKTHFRTRLEFLLLKSSWYHPGIILASPCHQQINDVSSWRHPVLCRIRGNRTYERTYLHTYIHTYIRTYVRMYVRAYIRTYVSTYVRMYVRRYVRTYVLTYVCTYVHTYVRQPIHMFTPAYV